MALAPRLPPPSPRLCSKQAVTGHPEVSAMGEMVDFPSNGQTGSGYLATSASGRGPGVIVIQEWWGLVPRIGEVSDRLALAGFFGRAPGLLLGGTWRVTGGEG